MAKILITEDDKDICEILRFNLASDYEVRTVFSAEEALEENLHTFDLFILDVMMEGMSGFQLAEKLRTELKVTTPIIFLTAKSSENDLLTGFNIGADDYITKPFSVNVIRARVRAVLRRNQASIENSHASDKLVFDELVVDTLNKQLFLNNDEVKLTKTEFEMLLLFAQKPGVLLSREIIVNQLWPENTYVSKRTVDVHVARLRKKMGEYGKYIVNRVGYGYKFDFE